MDIRDEVDDDFTIAGGRRYEPEDDLEPPLPLTRELPAGAAYPIAALGPLADAARAIQDLTQAPIAIAAQSMLAATSHATQAHANVETFDRAPSPISLYLVTIAGSSERKSACDRQAMTALADYEADLRRDFVAELKAFKAEKLLYDRQVQDALKAGNALDGTADLLALIEPKPPLVPTLRVDDPTSEGLIKLMLAARPSLIVATAEGGSVIGGYALNKDNKLKTAADYSKLWGGDVVTRSRSLDGTVTIAGRRLAMHLMAQPDVAAQLVSDKTLIDQGFLSRALISAPPSAVGSQFYKPADQRSVQVLADCSARLGALLRQPPRTAEHDRQELQPPTLVLSPAARDRLIRFHDDGVRRMTGEWAPIIDFAGKTPEHACRIAAVLSLYDSPDCGAVTETLLECAIALVEYYASETLRLRVAAMPNQALVRAQALLDWLRRTWRQPLVSAIECYQNGPRQFRDAETACQAIDALTEHGWLLPIQGGAVIGRYHRRQAWRLHPSLLAT